MSYVCHVFASHGHASYIAVNNFIFYKPFHLPDISV